MDSKNLPLVVVLVEAQRPASALSADGPLNLLNAIRAAAAEESRGRGVLVVLNEEINGARDARNGVGFIFPLILLQASGLLQVFAAWVAAPHAPATLVEK